MSSLPIPTGLPDPADLSVPHLSMPEISMPELSSSSLAKSATGENARGEGERFLLQAFRSFSEAADSLERSYGSLRSEVVRLRSELEHSNAGLASSLEENRRMRERLDNIVGGLPCGVLVVESGDAISLLNPEGRRLLRSIVKLTSEEGVEFLSSVPGELDVYKRQAVRLASNQRFAENSSESSIPIHRASARGFRCVRSFRNYLGHCRRREWTGHSSHAGRLGSLGARPVQTISGSILL